MIKDISFLKESLNANNFTFNHADEKNDYNNNVSSVNINNTQDSIQIQDLKDSFVNPILDQLQLLNNNTNMLINENKTQNQNISNHSEMINKVHHQYESLISLNMPNNSSKQEFTDTLRNLSKINNEIIDESITITE